MDGNFNDQNNREDKTFYRPSNYQNSQEIPEDEQVMSFGDWLITLLVVTFVPCVGLIMLFVWAFGNGNKNRKNFCRAYLVVVGITTVLMLICYLTMIPIIFSVIEG